jgi:hypothetical protein
MAAVNMSALAEEIRKRDVTLSVFQTRDIVRVLFDLLADHDLSDLVGTIEKIREKKLSADKKPVRRRGKYR